MIFIPIFIYEDRPSKEELRREAERDRRMRDAIRKDEERERRRKALELWTKKCEEAEKRKKLEEEYYEAERKNPWDFQFLPEGWSILGQTYIPVINDYGYAYDGNEDDLEGGYNDLRLLNAENSGSLGSLRQSVLTAVVFSSSTLIKTHITTAFIVGISLIARSVARIFSFTTPVQWPTQTQTKSFVT